VIIGVPREIKNHETRVGLVPGGVAMLREDGHQVLVEPGAGEGSRIEDHEYRGAGAEIVPRAAEVWQRADLVVKVKEPQPAEVPFFRPGLVLFTYLHLAPLPELTAQLLENEVNAVAYETIREPGGALPLLTPMSEVAGRLAAQIGAFYLEAPNGGRGVLLGGVPGVSPGNVAILGGGVAGTHAARIAFGMGARVNVIDINLNRLRQLDDIFNSQVITMASNPVNIASALAEADLVVGAVLIPGATAPRLIRREMVTAMKKGSVFVDVAIDQGGCSETSRVTTHADPIYVVDDVLHYCVANIPAAVPRSSTFALTNATLPYLREIARNGLEDAVRENPSLREGLNTYRGMLTHQGVALSQKRSHTSVEAAMRRD
jgi:alanine dehydrogenase